MKQGEPTRTTASSPRVKWAAVVLIATFTLSLLRVHFLNDHFDRITRARQILVYGEHPFADFRDPGYFLTLYTSAAGQALTGGGLLGEALIAAVGIASATTITFWLAESASGSLMVALFAVLTTWAVPPRYYDYDKVLFYMGALAILWRYADARTRGPLVALGVVTALAALFRYDNGLYVLAACLVAIAVHQRRNPSRRRMDLALYAIVFVVALVPALIFVHRTAGLAEALRQIASYAAREGHRSGLLDTPRLSLNLTSLTYVVVAAMAPLALIELAFRRQAPDPLQPAHARIAAVAVLSLCVTVFVLRDPIDARLGAAIPPALVLAAWLIGRHRPASIHISAQQERRVAAWAALAGVGAAGLIGVVPSERARLGRRVSAVANDLFASPAPMSYFPDDGALAGMTRYLQACTRSDSRVVLTWFAPEVFFFAQRGFGGGMAVFLGEHWSTERDQRRTVEQLKGQSVPLVILQSSSAAAFRSAFPLIARYFDSQYSPAGVTSFADPRVDASGYQILSKRDLEKAPRDPDWGLPCPAMIAPDATPKR